MRGKNMGLGRFVKSIFNDEVMGEEIINHNVNAYHASKTMSPNETSLFWLSNAYYGRMRSRGVTVTDLDAQYACSKFDKLPEPNNARALGLSMLMQERMDIFNKYSKFARELEMYMDQIDKN